MLLNSCMLFGGPIYQFCITEHPGCSRCFAIKTKLHFASPDIHVCVISMFSVDGISGGGPAGTLTVDDLATGCQPSLQAGRTNSYSFKPNRRCLFPLCPSLCPTRCISWRNIKSLALRPRPAATLEVERALSRKANVSIREEDKAQRKTASRTAGRRRTTQKRQRDLRSLMSWGPLLSTEARAGDGRRPAGPAGVGVGAGSAAFPGSEQPPGYTLRSL